MVVRCALKRSPEMSIFVSFTDLLHPPCPPFCLHKKALPESSLQTQNLQEDLDTRAWFYNWTATASSYV